MVGKILRPHWHYATDVIGGWIIGAVYLAFFIKYGYKKIAKKSKKTF